MVSSELRTAVVMRECDDLFDRRIVLKFLLEELPDILGNAVHTSYRRDDPEFVADAGTAVLSSVTLEECLLGSRRDLGKIRLI